MKKIITSLFLICAIGMQAQISMQNHPWVLGPAQFKYYTTQNGGLNMVGNSGTNQVYDFSNFNVNDSIEVSLMDVKDFHHASDFPNSNLYSFDGNGGISSDSPDSMWSFYKSGTGFFVGNAMAARMKPSLGSIFISAQYTYGYDTMIASYMNYGYKGNFTYGFFAIGAGGPADTIHKELTYKTIEVDGWGKMKYQGREFDVLRFKITEARTENNGRGFDSSFSYSFFSNIIPGEMARIDMKNNWTNINYVMVADIPSNIGITPNVYNESKLSLYPNPVQNELYIGSSELNGGSICSIYDLSGRKIMESSLNKSMVSVNVASLMPGIYIFRLTDADGHSIDRKFVKE